VRISKVVTALTMTVALAAPLMAAPQATKQDPAKAAPTTKAVADTVKLSDLPKAVTDAVMKAHPKAKIDSATKTGTGATLVYAVKITDSGKNSTIRLHEDGSIVAAAKKKGK
jgi:hypothetical protein